MNSPYMSKQSTRPISELSEEDQIKTRLFNKRGYEYCRYTNVRIINLNDAVYDKELDCFFKDIQAQKEYYKEKSYLEVVNNIVGKKHSFSPDVRYKTTKIAV